MRDAAKREQLRIETRDDSRSVCASSPTPPPRSSPAPLIEIHRARAVAERRRGRRRRALQRRQHRVGHRRAVGRLDVQAALERAAGLAGEEQRAALVIVDVRVAHRRSVDHQRVVEQVAVAVRRVLQLLQEIRQHADVVAVDLREVEDAILAIAVVRRRVEAGVDAAVRVDAARRVAAHLEREHARGVRRERHRLQVEHQLDVLVERVGHADRRGRESRAARRSCCRPRPSGCGARSRALHRDSWRGARDRRRRARGSGDSSCALIKSRMLLSSARRSARSSGVAPTPNS